MNGPTTDVRLIPAQLDALRPTQITVGYREARYLPGWSGEMPVA